MFLIPSHQGSRRAADRDCSAAADFLHGERTAVGAVRVEAEDAVGARFAQRRHLGDVARSRQHSDVGVELARQSNDLSGARQAGRAQDECARLVDAGGGQAKEEFGGFVSPEIFEALAVGDAEPDAAKRTELYQEANRVIMDFLPAVPISHSPNALVVAENVEGLVPSPLSAEDFSTVTISD